MQQLIDHLRSLTKHDAIALDTEGHGNPYVGARVDLIQICTSQKECFLLDVHRCHGLPLMRQLEKPSHTEEHFASVGNS